MNIEEIREYCISKNAVTEEFPFDEETLVFKVGGKMFALVGLEHVPLKVSLKCDPERALELRDEYDGLITESYHMSKKHWNAVFAESLPPDFVKELIDHSYDLVVKGMSKKQRELLK